jgi:hypothetical protein
MSHLEAAIHHLEQARALFVEGVHGATCHCFAQRALAALMGVDGGD